MRLSHNLQSQSGRSHSRWSSRSILQWQRFVEEDKRHVCQVIEQSKRSDSLHDALHKRLGHRRGAGHGEGSGSDRVPNANHRHQDRQTREPLCSVDQGHVGGARSGLCQKQNWRRASQRSDFPANPWSWEPDLVGSHSTRDTTQVQGSGRSRWPAGRDPEEDGSWKQIHIQGSPDEIFERSRDNPEKSTQALWWWLGKTSMFQRLHFELLKRPGGAECRQILEGGQRRSHSETESPSRWALERSCRSVSPEFQAFSL